MRFLTFLSLLAGTAFAAPHARQSEDYEYIVVGSGPGGGPLASRLARAGHSTLLIEAGDDQGSNANYSVPGYQGLVAQDPRMRWDMYCNHYQDLEQAKRDPKFSYDIGNGEVYTGLNPPGGAEPLGVLYPRAGTLGGCNAHNALIWVEPHASDWSNIQSITGDDTWNPDNMHDVYLEDRVHSWQPVHPTDPTILARDLVLTRHLLGGAATKGLTSLPVVDGLTGILPTLLVDPNGDFPGRDSKEGFFQIPLIQQGGARKSVRERIVDTINEGYPLTVKSNTFVTKVDFDQVNGTARATGVQYLEGSYLYRASPLSGGEGTPGSARASKEVILSGGTYNTVQMLKLSGIGPRSELESHGIEVISDLPGVGTNMQDRYEIPLSAVHPDDFAILDGCTFDMKSHDKCYPQWRDNLNILAARGAYATNGLAAAMAQVSTTSPTGDVDLYIFGGPVNFIGYFPQWGDFAVSDHKHFSWYALKAHSQNHAGTVTLRSTDPLDPPEINFNYFDEGTTANGEDEADLQSLVEALRTGREALANYDDYPILGGSGFEEERPGANVTSDADLKQYIKDQAWGHHACCTAKIGADDDAMAVLDSKFRVRGVAGLRVVDASVFPRIPGVFIQAPIMMVSEKAADAILGQEDAGQDGGDDGSGLLGLDVSLGLGVGL
ncbi:glucose-methanol-choline oxidoreductase-like protein [Hortaea werneckii]|nr:glucose-methanol-choline oxidoreductase-like protein [Hortaea werneckii]KAI7301406.1 glucose-methanol-choline oxidoreductase-like protein [Hortaea werneckii]